VDIITVLVDLRPSVRTTAQAFRLRVNDTSLVLLYWLASRYHRRGFPDSLPPRNQLFTGTSFR
jgi:hypothetical protein